MTDSKGRRSTGWHCGAAGTPTAAAHQFEPFQGTIGRARPAWAVEAYRGGVSHQNHTKDELMNCNVMADVPGHWKAIESFNKVMHDYLRTCQPQWWIEAYFTTTMDGFKTTSNYAEQENARFKRLGLRAMPPLDFLDGVCKVVSEAATDAHNVAKVRMQKGSGR
eukprot:COSAG01_NODE_2484_length_7600_cov_2.596587_8_plen_164_part_00